MMLEPHVLGKTIFPFLKIEISFIDFLTEKQWIIDLMKYLRNFIDRRPRSK
jgi:hypothetical protein